MEIRGRDEIASAFAHLITAIQQIDWERIRYIQLYQLSHGGNTPWWWNRHDRPWQEYTRGDVTRITLDSNSNGIEAEPDLPNRANREER